MLMTRRSAIEFVRQVLQKAAVCLGNDSFVGRLNVVSSAHSWSGRGNLRGCGQGWPRPPPPLDPGDDLHAHPRHVILFPSSSGCLFYVWCSLLVWSIQQLPAPFGSIAMAVVALTVVLITLVSAKSMKMYSVFRLAAVHRAVRSGFRR
jgi:hypothetical protein